MFGRREVRSGEGLGFRVCEEIFRSEGRREVFNIGKGLRKEDDAGETVCEEIFRSEGRREVFNIGKGLRKEDDEERRFVGVGLEPSRLTFFDRQEYSYVWVMALP